MKIERKVLAAILLVGAITRAAAFAPDGCEQQRSQYPVNWNDTSHEKPLFDCYAPQAGAFRFTFENPTKNHDDKEQSRLFLKIAREIEADEQNSVSDQLFGRLAR